MKNGEGGGGTTRDSLLGFLAFFYRLSLFLTTFTLLCMCAREKRKKEFVCVNAREAAAKKGKRFWAGSEARVFFSHSLFKNLWFLCYVFLRLPLSSLSPLPLKTKPRYRFKSKTKGAITQIARASLTMRANSSGFGVAAASSLQTKLYASPSDSS